MKRSNVYCCPQSTMRLSLVFCTLFTLFGCASTTGYDRLYTGPDKPLQEIALLTHRDPYSQIMIIQLVDDKPAVFSGLSELLPGKHTVTTSFAMPSSGDKVTRSKGLADISFYAQAGHVYVLHLILDNQAQSWRPAIWDISSELSNPNHQQLLKKIDDILKAKRASKFSSSVTFLAKSVPQNNLAYYTSQINTEITYI